MTNASNWIAAIRGPYARSTSHALSDLGRLGIGHAVESRAATVVESSKHHDVDRRPPLNDAQRRIQVLERSPLVGREVEFQRGDSILGREPCVRCFAEHQAS